MGVFTEQMTRLCAEIVGLKRGRQAFERGLAQDSRTRQRTVCQMRAEYNNARQVMSQKTRQDRLTFLTAIRRAVQSQRQAMQTEPGGSAPRLGR